MRPKVEDETFSSSRETALHHDFTFDLNLFAVSGGACGPSATSIVSMMCICVGWLVPDFETRQMERIWE